MIAFELVKLEEIYFPQIKSKGRKFLQKKQKLFPSWFLKQSPNCGTHSALKIFLQQSELLLQRKSEVCCALGGLNAQRGANHLYFSDSFNCGALVMKLQRIKTTGGRASRRGTGWDFTRNINIVPVEKNKAFQTFLASHSNNFNARKPGQNAHVR